MGQTCSEQTQMQLSKLMGHSQIDENQRASLCNMTGDGKVRGGGEGNHTAYWEKQDRENPPANLVWKFLKAISPHILTLFNHQG